MRLQKKILLKNIIKNSNREENEKMTIVRSPLRYPGGKSKALDAIIPLIPHFTEYREPFMGGGSIFLAVKQKYGENKKYWVNDLYYSVYNFWQVCQKHPKEMIKLLFEWKKDYTNGKLLQQYLRINSYRFSEIEKACAYLVRNRTSFSGFEGGFSEYSYEKRFTENNINSLDDISKILKNVKITNLDYQKVIETECNNGVSEDKVFYVLDPPYFDVVSTELYGKDGSLHRYFDHQRFANVMKECSETTKYRWLITYDDSNTVRRLFNWANIIPWKLKYSSRSSKIGNEVLISNYDINSLYNRMDIQTDIERIWEN